jgi:lipopolysaccharide export LptBFGC system permease protein LptF
MDTNRSRYKAKRRKDLTKTIAILLSVIIICALLGFSVKIGFSKYQPVEDTLVGILSAYGFYGIYSLLPKVSDKTSLPKIIGIIIVSAILIILVMFMVVSDFAVVQIFGISVPQSALSEIFGGLIGAWAIYLVSDVLVKRTIK